MSKQLKVGKSKVSSAAKTVVRESRTAAASAPSAPPVTVQVGRHADPSLLDPYDWGPEGVPKGKPLRYVPGQGFVLED